MIITKSVTVITNNVASTIANTFKYNMQLTNKIFSHIEYFINSHKKIYSTNIL